MSTWRQRSVRYIALATLLGAMGAISRSTLHAIDREPDAAEAKVRAAERLIAYQVFPDRGPVFQIEGGGARFKVASAAVVDGAYDATRAISYGLRLTVHDGERVAWTSDVYLQTRQSKDGWDGTRWRDEAAWAIDPIEVADERLVILDLPMVPANATLRVTLLGQPREALIRMFREAPRSGAQRRAAALRLDDAARAKLIGSSTYVPWPMLTGAEQDARLLQRWLQIAAEGQHGVNFSTRTIFVTDFRTPFAAGASQDAVEVSPGHDAAINVRGPAHLSLSRLDAVTTALVVSAVGAAGRIPVAIAHDGSIDVGPAPITLVFSTHQPGAIRFTLSGPSDVLIAASDARPPEPGLLVPDHVRVPLMVAGVGAVVTANMHHVPGAPLLGRGLRVDARVLAETFSDEPTVTAMTVSYLAADGRRLGSDHVPVGGEMSRFERLAFGSAGVAVTEPTSFRVLAPEGTARVELASERDVAVRLYRWGPGRDLIEEPYRVVPVVDHRWRYARLVERSWFPMLASNHDVLAATGRLAQLDAQVRLEPAGHLPQRGTADYAPLRPLGKPEQQRAREPVPPEELAAVISAWPAGSLTELAAGTEREFDFSPAILGRPRLSWVVEPAAVGGELALTIDGERTSVPLTSTRGAADLPRIPPGRHRVRVEGAASALWIDRPPVGTTRGIVRERTLYALDLRGLSVRVRQRPGEDIQVYAIIYAQGVPASTKTQLVMTVDGRRPVRRTGVAARLTTPELRVPVPAARRDVPALLVDLGGRTAGLPRSIGIGLLGDLAPGLHEIDLHRIGGLREEPLWVRFVTTHHVREAAAPAAQWPTRSGPRLDVLDE